MTKQPPRSGPDGSTAAPAPDSLTPVSTSKSNQPVYPRPCCGGTWLQGVTGHSLLKTFSFKQPRSDIGQAFGAHKAPPRTRSHLLDAGRGDKTAPPSAGGTCAGLSRPSSVSLWGALTPAAAQTNWAGDRGQWQGEGQCTGAGAQPGRGRRSELTACRRGLQLSGQSWQTWGSAGRSGFWNSSLRG